MSNGILVFVEHRAGAINKISYEAIAAAQEIGAKLNQPVSAVLFGANFQDLAQQVTAYKLDGVVYADNEKLAEYTPDGYADAMEHVVRARDPFLVIFPHTYLVRDFCSEAVGAVRQRRYQRLHSRTDGERRTRFFAPYFLGQD